MRTRTDTILPSARYGSHIDLNQPSVTLEQLDVHSFALDANKSASTECRSLAECASTKKFVNPDGSEVIVLIIKSSSASGMGVHFRNFALAEREVYVYGAAPDSIVFVRTRTKDPGQAENFVWHCRWGHDRYRVLQETDENGKGFEIFEVSHIFAELDWRVRSNEPDVLNCEVDASCYGDPEKNAVGRLYSTIMPHVCTGTLLKRCCARSDSHF